MSRQMLLLIAAVVVSAMMVVDLRQQNRLQFAQLQMLTRERDALNVEWGQLLLEQGAWSEHRRVEDTARARLGMAMPSSGQVVIVREGRPQP